jgi:hypothetical protein
MGTLIPAGVYVHAVPGVHVEAKVPAIVDVSPEMIVETIGVKPVIELLQYEIYFFHMQLARRCEKNGVRGLRKAACAWN